MKEVTKDEFYEFISDKNVKYFATGDYPYTGIWKDHYGNIIAKCVESFPENSVYPLISKYFIQ